MNIFEKLVLGGSVFGWSANKNQSFQVLDYFYAHGGRTIDTSDFYSEWVPGNTGGESEVIIGEWLESRKLHAKIRLVTKFGLSSKRLGFGRDNIIRAASDSRARLRVDHIGVYMPHRTPLFAESHDFIDAMGHLYSSSLIESVGFSHCDFESLKKLKLELDTCKVPVSIVEDNFNLVERELKDSVIPWASNHNLEFVAARGLAGGFLTGKYTGIKGNSQLRTLTGLVSHFSTTGKKVFLKKYRASLTSASVGKYLDSVSPKLFLVLKDIAKSHDTNIVSVVLSWTLLQKGVQKTCVSFRTISQMKNLKLTFLSDTELARIESCLDETIYHA